MSMQFKIAENLVQQGASKVTADAEAREYVKAWMDGEIEPERMADLMGMSMDEFRESVCYGVDPAECIRFNELDQILSGVTAEINDRLHNKAFTDDPYVIDYVRIQGEYFPGQRVKLQVNWSCLGSVDSDKAVAYAEAIREAAEYCETSSYNGMMVTW